MPGGIFFAVAFFLVLFFAAITSAVSMLEVRGTSLQESLDRSRMKATLLMDGIVSAVGQAIRHELQRCRPVH